MTIAKDINDKLDEILKLRAEIRVMDSELDDDQVLNNVQTGEKTNKAGAIEVAEDMINQIKIDLNKITNNGLNVNEIFTNNYYVNDFMQDREIARQIKEEEIRLNSPAPVVGDVQLYNKLNGIPNN
mgnify:FL=1|tara:strand:- start:1140 stop:1517 length:378 start_codon:yes stop_codon:yes gene_type:complete